MRRLRNVTKDVGGVADISAKEITIPLAEYTDLIANETIAEQIRFVVNQHSNSSYIDIGLLRAILQIEMSEKE